MALFDFFKGKNAQMTVEEKKYIQNLKEGIIEYVDMHKQGQITKDDLKKMCVLLVQYCKLTRYPQFSLETPMVQYKTFYDNTLASYMRDFNLITVGDGFLDGILSGKYNLSDLFNAIGHEMKHYHQNAIMIEYDKLSVEEQSKFDQKMKESIDAYKKYFILSDSGLRRLVDVDLSEYLPEIPISEYGELVGDMRVASYYTIQSEYEAREAGCSFAVDFFKELGLSERSPEISGLRRDNKNERLIYEAKKRKVDRFNEIYNLELTEIIRLVKELESDSYWFCLGANDALRFLIKDKTIEQKRILLKNAMFHGYTKFLTILIDSIVKDADFKKHKDEISKLISSYLLGKDPYKGVLSDNFQLTTEHFKVDYSKVLNQADLENIIIQTFGKKDFADLLVLYADIKEYSSDMILKCQEIAMQRPIEKSKWFFERLFKKATLTTKYKYLQTCELVPEIKEILECSIERDIACQDLEDHPEKGVIKRYINPEEESSQQSPTGGHKLSLIEGTGDNSLSGIIGAFHISGDTLYLHSRFGNSEEGKKALRKVRSANLPKLKTRLSRDEKKAMLRKAKNKHEIPAMKESIELLLPYLEQFTEIKNVSIKASGDFITYVQSALSDFGFEEVQIEGVDKTENGKGNNTRCLTISRELLIESIKDYQASKNGNLIV